MLALVKTAKGKGLIELKNVEEPGVKEDEVKIQVKACGICTTDLHILHDTIDYNPPVILGHEISGIIVEVGSKVKGVKIGDRVAADSHGHICHNCGYCQSGLSRYCLERTMVGRHKNGGFAEYFVTKEAFVTVLGESIDMISGAMTQPFFKLTHCIIERCGIEAGSTVVIIGAGETGILSAQLAKAAGATVIMADTSTKLSPLKGETYGADKVLALDKENVQQYVSEITHGYGAACVIECSGTQEGLTLGLNLVQKLGKLLQLGVFGSKVEIDIDRVVSNGIALIGAAGTTWSAKQKAIELLKTGVVTPKKLVSEILPISRWEEGFRKKEAGLIIMLDPSVRQ